MSQTPSIFRVRAHNTAVDSENKIHDDRIAAQYGFRGGLVPGVAVYGYMIPAVLEHYGPAWIDRGGMSVRFVAPCYEGETVLSQCDGSVVAATGEGGALYASGKVTIADDNDAPAPYPVHPLPEMQCRPPASSETILPGSPLGSIVQELDVRDQAGIPERLLRMANEILVRNFVMSPWIHAGSEALHHHRPVVGQAITVSGMILERFERKGRRFATAGLTLAAGERTAASVRHTFIYAL